MYRTSNVKHWTDIQIFCYERNCICENCLYQEYNNGRCKIKKSLIEKIKNFGLESGVKTKQWLQE